MFHSLAHTLGLDNVAGMWYAFWSGFGSIAERGIDLAVIGGLIYHRNNCHQRGCPRLGRFPAVECGGWHYCRKHHTTNGEHQ